MGVRRTLTLLSAFVAAMTLLVTGAVAQNGVGPYVFHGDFWKPKPLPTTPAVGDHELSRPKTLHPRGYRPLTRYKTTKPAWPQAGSHTVALQSKPARAGSLPVWVASASGKGASGCASNLPPAHRR